MGDCMKILLIFTAVLEGLTGLALLLAPALPVSLLLGISLDTSGGVVVARVAGAAVLSLGVACWVASGDGRSRAARGLVTAMSLYNVVVAILAHAWLGLALSGLGLWPAAVLHLALAFWCMARLQAKPLKPR